SPKRAVRQLRSDRPPVPLRRLPLPGSNARPAPAPHAGPCGSRSAGDVPNRSLEKERRVAMSGGPEVLARLEGPLSLGDAEDLLNWMQPLCAVARRVVLDLRGVEQIDAAGVRVLVLLQEELAAA